MNGFADKGLDESNFGLDRGKSPINAVKAFDAFPKVKTNYTERTSNGGAWTLTLICLSLWLSMSELGRWWKGHTTHTFSVEQGVGRDLQINLDMVMPMKCDDVHVNVQDASGDRILAGQALTRNPTSWSQWGKARGRMHSLGSTREERILDANGYPDFSEYREEDVHDYLGAARSSKKFSKTPKLPRGTEADSCRIFGTMHTNKVQGDFHVTARGHGYMEFAPHLEHSGMYNVLESIERLSNTDGRLLQPSISAILLTSYLLDRFIRVLLTRSTTLMLQRKSTSSSFSITSPWFRPSTQPIPKRYGRSTSIPSHPHQAQTLSSNIAYSMRGTQSSRISTP